MLRVLYSDSELLTLGYVGKVNAVVGEALFDGLIVVKDMLKVMLLLLANIVIQLKTP